VNRRVTVAAVAVKIGTTKVSFIDRTVFLNGTAMGSATPQDLDLSGSLANPAGVTIQNGDKCLRVNVNTGHRNTVWYHNIKVRMLTPSADGICGGFATPKTVEKNKVLFTDDQMRKLCNQCGEKPYACLAGGEVVPTTITGEEPGAKETCKTDVKYNSSKDKCLQHYNIHGANDDSLNHCIQDYCAGDGDVDSQTDSIANTVRELGRQPGYIYYAGQLSDAGCPAGEEILTPQECEGALATLHLCHEKGAEGSFPDRPGYCSHRPSNCLKDPEWNFNNAQTGVGAPDATPICRRELKLQQGDTALPALVRVHAAGNNSGEHATNTILLEPEPVKASSAANIPTLANKFPVRRRPRLL
jgi:hypothetical protein